MIDIYIERGMDADDAEVRTARPFLSFHAARVMDDRIDQPTHRRLTRSHPCTSRTPVNKQDVVRKMAKYDGFFVNVMMVEELGLQVPDPDDDIVKEGVIMFLSFAGFGAMPLLGCVLACVPACLR